MTTKIGRETAVHPSTNPAAAAGSASLRPDLRSVRSNKPDAIMTRSVPKVSVSRIDVWATSPGCARTNNRANG